MEPVFFSNPAAFRKWLQKNHASQTELLVGYYKVHTGKAGMSWSQSVDEALCFGWIDGVRTSIDADRYQIRFTPRRPDSIWSNVNIKKMEELIAAGRMQAAGLKVFEKRTEAKSKVYSFETEAITLSKEFTAIFKANKKAWQYFDALAASYKKVSVHWVMSAKKEETKLSRLQTLIANSENGTNPWKDNKYTKK
ncbi:MAG TPA: YdeI/OmpD-associated family protein [Phnomibacter sp.]|nr:YdeI/OmpD-associated family protein [Phnomibacter sp.]